jgi:hypothetical protein
MRAIAIGAAGVLLLIACAACTAAPAALPRSEPNAEELSAQAIAQSYSFPVSTRGPIWVQLWTPNQVGPEIERCVRAASHGVLSVTVSPPGAGGGAGFSYQAGIVGDGLDPQAAQYSDPVVAGNLIGTCIASAPVDERRMLVPTRDRDALYSYDLTVLRHCLIAHGQKIGSMPTRTRYENLIRASDPWSPYDTVRVADRTAWYVLSDACPALPNAIAGDVAAISTSATTP